MEYQTKLKNDIIQCDICPRECKLRNNQTGFCRVRKNIEGNIVLTTYNRIAALAIDPIEKKPLYHFYPSSNILSIGTLGCNMGCLFCQNSHITKIKNIEDYPDRRITADEIIEIAKKAGIKSIAFTYNEPVIFLEFAHDIALKAHDSGIKTALISSGFINPAPRKDFFPLIDAFNIDLKGFSEVFYQKNCLAKLKPVLDSLEFIKSIKAHLEITTLLIEGKNNSDKMLKEECRWIKDNLGENSIIHFSAFHPAYKFLNYPKTHPETLYRAYDIAKSEGLNYVYCGNITNREKSSTYCKNCKKMIIERDGFRVLKNNLDKNGNCIFCKTPCDGEF